MKTIIITEEFENENDMIDTLRMIADSLENGCTSGYYPNWETKGEYEEIEED